MIEKITIMKSKIFQEFLKKLFFPQNKNPRVTIFNIASRVKIAVVKQSIINKSIDNLLFGSIKGFDIAS